MCVFFSKAEHPVFENYLLSTLMSKLVKVESNIFFLHITSLGSNSNTKTIWKLHNQFPHYAAMLHGGRDAKRYNLWLCKNIVAWIKPLSNLTCFFVEKFVICDFGESFVISF